VVEEVCLGGCGFGARGGSGGLLKRKAKIGCKLMSIKLTREIGGVTACLFLNLSKDEEAPWKSAPWRFTTDQDISVRGSKEVGITPKGFPDGGGGG